MISLLCLMPVAATPQAMSGSGGSGAPTTPAHLTKETPASPDAPNKNGSNTSSSYGGGELSKKKETAATEEYPPAWNVSLQKYNAESAANATAPTFIPLGPQQPVAGRADQITPEQVYGEIPQRVGTTEDGNAPLETVEPKKDFDTQRDAAQQTENKPKTGIVVRVARFFAKMFGL